MATYHTIGGKRYKEATFSPRKSDATYIKNKWQKDGYFVRVLKRKNGYLVCVRKK